MNPETDVAALPAINWTLEILKLIVPPLLTGVAVLIGARVAYHFANKGRKEDILYKERYKSFEEVAGFLYETKRKFEDLKAADLDSSKNLAPFLIDLRRESRKTAISLLGSQPNRRHLVLLGSSTNTSYHSVLGLLVEMIHYLRDRGEMGRETVYHDPIYVDIALEDLWELKGKFTKIIETTNENLRLAKIDIDLPEK